MRDIPRPVPTCDLDTPAEIAEMVRRFYSDVTQYDLLGPMFNEVPRVDWDAHLPKLAGFWCRALLGQPGYQGNPFRAHMLVHTQRQFTPAHFERWLTLFHETLGAISTCAGSTSPPRNAPASPASNTTTPLSPPAWMVTSLRDIGIFRREFVRPG